MIHGLTLQLNAAGNIKIGRKGAITTSQQGKEFRPPEKLNHFQITTTEKNADGDFVVDTDLEKRIKEAGTGIINGSGNLIGIPIRLLYNDTELNFPTRLSSYVAGKLSCTGDGQKATKRVDDFKKESPCPCPRFDQGYDGKDKCKALGTLTCIIDEAGLFGQAHKFRTTSINSVTGILGGLEMIRTVTNNRVAGLPLMLTINPKSTTTPQGANTIVYVVSLCYRGSMNAMREEVLQIMNKERQYLIGMDQLEAEARNTQIRNPIISDDEQKEVAEEFYPDCITLPAEPIAEPTPIPDEPEKEELQELALTQETTEESTGEPLGTYKEIYIKLCKETDYEKAVALVKRLTKGNLIYYLEQHHPEIKFDDNIKKPELVAICEEALACLVGEVIETPIDEWEHHPEYIKINEIQDRKQFLDAVSAFFRPTPIDRTKTRVELLKEVKEGLKAVFEIKQPPEQSEVNTPVEEEIKPEKKQTPEPEIIPKLTEPTINYNWDDESGLIEKDQLKTLVGLKKELEFTGVLDVTKPEIWANDFVGKFLDHTGSPHKTATKMSKNQGNSLIEILEAKIDTTIPF